ncbi:MAG: phytanoyl-CoA dioxygenase family protein [Chitinophagales bacterium]|nr:phytanoyl-CoA dioxygenase family protein [Chitinophagales bacterium]MDW8419189.1 phytanoyl-CoA dioxygenase family protein [Chitinophagales bacterium]
MLFKDEKLQRLFDLNGYVIVPFLQEQQVRELRDYFFATHPQIPDGFYSSSFNHDAGHKKSINEKIESVLHWQVAAYFNNIKKLGSCFLCKRPGPSSAMPIHQDWTVVDEPNYDSVTIWIPLQDVDETNGAMQVVEGSHRFSVALRAPSLEDPLRDIQAELREDLKTLPMKAGEALIFSHALIHASPPNMREEPRIVVTYGLVDNGASLMFYHKSENGKIEQYKVGEDFFQRYNTQIGERPRFGKLLRTLDYSQQYLTPTDYRKAKLKYKQTKAECMYKMKPIFKDEARQRLFEQEGFVVFPLLNAGEVDELKSFYFSLGLKDEKGYGFHVSMDQGDKELCRRVRDKIWSVALPRLSEHLLDFKPFVASFVAKEVNPRGVVPAHQDWSFVEGEEEGYASITCWIALVDTNLDNGGMGVIRGSHKFMQNHRPSPSPQCPVPLSEHMFSIFPYLHTIDMKAGEVLMFDNRTFHASPPNTSDGIRLAAGVGVTQKDAQLVHYYMKPDGTFKTMLRYRIDEDFFLKYENATLSKMYDERKLIEGYGEPAEVPYEYTKYTSDELIEIIKAAGNTYNTPMVEKLAKLFGYEQPQSSHKENGATISHEPVQTNGKQQEVVAEWKDNRSFFQKYTPLNIARELRRRLTGN